MRRINYGDGIVPQWPGRLIQEWRGDRCRFCDEEVRKGLRKRKTEYNRYKKIEIYRYIKKADWEKCVAYIKKAFRVETSIPVKTASLLLAMQGRTTFFSGGAARRVNFISASEVAKALMFSNVHLYHHHYVGIIKKRGGHLLIHIYEAISRPKQDVKLEIIYLADTLENLGPKENHRKNIEKISSIIEMAKKINKEFPLYMVTDHTTPPGGVHIRTLVKRSEKFLTSRQKKEIKDKRYRDKMLYDKSLDWMA